MKQGCRSPGGAKGGHSESLSPENLENTSNFQGWGLTPVTYKKICILISFYFYVVHAFFTSNTFKSNFRLKLAKNQANAKQHP